MKSWERWVVLGALLAWPLLFAVVTPPLSLDSGLSNLLLFAGWVVVLGIFILRIYRSSDFLRADLARERTANRSAVISAVILTTLDGSTPKDGLIVVLVADATGVRLIGRDSAVVGAVLWRGVLKLEPLDRNFVFLVTKPQGGTEEWRVTPCEADFIRPFSVEKRDTLLAQLEGLRADAA